MEILVSVHLDKSIIVPEGPVLIDSINNFSIGIGSSLQQLSVYLSICIKSMLHSAKNKSIYDNKLHVRNDYFVIDSNEPILDFLSYDNTQKGLKSVSTYDFSTLYTSIYLFLIFN